MNTNNNNGRAVSQARYGQISQNTIANIIALVVIAIWSVGCIVVYTFIRP